MEFNFPVSPQSFYAYNCPLLYHIGDEGKYPAPNIPSLLFRVYNIVFFFCSKILNVF